MMLGLALTTTRVYAARVPAAIQGQGRPPSHPKLQLQLKPRPPLVLRPLVLLQLPPKYSLIRAILLLLLLLLLERGKGARKKMNPAIAVQLLPQRLPTKPKPQPM